MTESALVIGAGGFIGQHLVRRLARQGRRVIAITRRAGVFEHPNVRWNAEETPSVDSWRALLNDVDTVVYLASVSTPAGSAGRPVSEAVSLMHLLTLLEALQAFPQVRLIYASSAGSLYTPNNGEASDETDPISPRSYHGANKAAGEAFVGSWCAQFGGAATVLRPSNVYGPGQLTSRGFGVIPAAFWHMRHGNSMDIWGDGAQTRDYIYIDDLIDLCIAATVQRPRGLEIYNAASGRSTSLNELLHVMEEVSGVHLLRTYHEQRATDASRVAVDASKAQVRFGWAARTNLRAGIEETWRWYRSIEA